MNMSINIARLEDYPVVAADVETTGKYWYKDRMFGIALAAWDGERIQSAYWDVREKPQIMDMLREKLPHVRKLVNHHVKFDCHFLMNEKIKVPLDRIECTMVRAGLINEHEISGANGGYGLDALCKKYIGEGKVDIWPELASLFGGAPTRAVQIRNLHRAPSALAAKYAAPDPALALKLWLWQEEEMKRQDLAKIWGLERALTPILVQIERQGIRVDVERTEAAVAAVNKQVETAQRDLDALAGKPVNANSAPQMRALFGCSSTDLGNGRKQWATDAGVQLEQTDGGNPSLDKDALIRLSELGDDRAKHIATIRRMTKGRSFLTDHILGHEVKGYVYPNYNQTKTEHGLGTGTGRFSIDDPAMQQIPMHDIDVAEIVRPCFVPRPKEKWGCADWKQFEFRWFAHYTKDPGILAKFEADANADFHQITADITGITRDRKFAGDTANAKQINLGLVFGMGEGEMAYNMGMPFDLRIEYNRDGTIKREWKIAGPEAKAIFAKYHDAIPGVKKLLQEASSIARARGHVLTAMGRRIRFPGGKFLHKAAGLVFQGSSADCMKLKMVELWPICQKLGVMMQLTVHDELDFSAHDELVPESSRVIKEALQTFDGKKCPVWCRVPILTDLNWGINWWEACK